MSAAAIGALALLPHSRDCAAALALMNAVATEIPALLPAIRWGHGLVLVR